MKYYNFFVLIKRKTKIKKNKKNKKQNNKR